MRPDIGENTFVWRRLKSAIAAAAFAWPTAPLANGPKPLEVSFCAVHLGLRHDHLRLCARDFAAAQVLRRKVLLLVDLEEKVALLDLRAFGEAYALDVAVYLRQDVGHLRRQ